MTPAVATVLSARSWEHDLVALAHESAAVRLVLRAYRPDEVEREAPRIDVVVAGAEVSWVTPARLATWRRLGMCVIGMFPRGDRPARDRLIAGGVDEVLPDDTPAEALVHTIRLLQPRAPVPKAAETPNRITVVTGPRGAPGRTEVALTLAWSWAITTDVMLLDLDLSAPALAVRLGQPPRPDITDAAEEVHTGGAVPSSVIQRFGPLRVIVGSHRNGDGASTDSIDDLVSVLAATGRRIVIDAGPREGGDPLLGRVDDVVLVAEGTPTGLVRAAALVSAWTGRTPRLVLNRVPDRMRDDVVGAARRWTGLEPAAVLPSLRTVASAARAAQVPPRAIRRALRPMGIPT